MPSRLRDRLNSARHQHFIGRAAEIALFAQALAATKLPFSVLYIYGPGGIGKTTLLAEYAHVAEQMGITAWSIDGYRFEATPDAFLTTLRSAMGIDPASEPTETLAENPSRQVLLIDTLDRLAPIEHWLRDVFLPQLTEQVLVVLTSRHPPNVTWRSDPGWQQLMRSVPLHNLSSDEATTYLTQRNIPIEDHPAILRFTHGHPLALSLIAGLYEQQPGYHFAVDSSHDIVTSLIERFQQQVAGPTYRAALEVCALARVTTESLLAEILALPDAHDLFLWLCELSFMQRSPDGLFPHDTAREALIADLRWRNRQWYAELRQRACDHYVKLIHRKQDTEQQLALRNLIYLHRNHPVIQPFFDWQANGQLLADSLHPDDLEPLCSMVIRHEGLPSGQLARYWLIRQPEQVVVFRDAQGTPVGFVILLALEHVSAEDLATDPAIASAYTFLHRQTGQRAGERATYFRFWMAADSYQAVSSIQSFIFVTMIHHSFIPGLAYTFYACADPEFWRPIFDYAKLHHLPELAFQTGDRTFGVYGHDWRTMPPFRWLELLGRHELATTPKLIRSPTLTSTEGLSREEFSEAVQHALRNYTRPDVLHSSRLLNSRIVTDLTENDAGDGARITALRKALKQAVEQLRESPRDHKLYRAVYHTYFQPAATQEHAAELLAVPLSSYRRHLKAGVARIIEICWHSEIDGKLT
ncbi:ATP-binding protein [Chloroflexus sp.]|uniref:ATP-binding protein n=1 Tax=Chloroflexus sp. TaxID=1904827 RepID=UPI00298F3560|nr:AAA family ATPase [Chloroflexus sp.]MCX7860128.1 hypothetical protein [Chloroflexus sp.]MDW8405173.1 hypothetical protein [Chloroflexus sp.]